MSGEGYGVTLNKVVNEDLDEKVTLEQRQRKDKGNKPGSYLCLCKGPGAGVWCFLGMQEMNDVRAEQLTRGGW